MTGMDRWVGKVALVTGANSGIGACTAEELVKRGLKVVGLDLNVERIEEIKNKLQGEEGELFPIKADVTKIEEVEAAFQWIKAKFGAIHVLINNAGIGRGGLVLDGKIELFQEVINVNLVGMIICTQKALQLMKASGVDDGHIININSIGGHSVPNTPVPMFNVYVASKHGVTGFTATLQQELRFLKSKIKASSISPGMVNTEFGPSSAKATGSKKEMPENLKQYMTSLPLLNSKDITDGIIYVLGTPPHVQVHELLIKPVGEPF